MSRVDDILATVSGERRVATEEHVMEHSTVVVTQPVTGRIPNSMKEFVPQDTAAKIQELNRQMQDAANLMKQYGVRVDTSKLDEAYNEVMGK